MRLVLASASPQRRDLMAGAGYRFEVAEAGIEERESGHDPIELALLNAEAKARAVSGRHPNAAVVGADTVVALDGHSFGKPADEAAARSMLTDLSGNRHEVHTGVCVIAEGIERSGVASTEVVFRELGAGEIEAHIALGEWEGRAGGYAIQESGGSLVESIDGDLDNVIGLPIALVAELLPDGIQAPRAD